DRMARFSGFDAFHLAHAFRAVVGMPPLEYVRVLRLERAAHDLVHWPEYSVERIAQAAGYTSSNAFRRAFARKFRSSPLEIRRIGLPASPRRPPPGEIRCELPPFLAAIPVVEAVQPFEAIAMHVPDPSIDALETAWRSFMGLAPAATEPWQWGV